MGIEKFFDDGILIGEGRTGKVYKIEGNPESLAIKIFSPKYFARSWNWFFYKSPHPLSTEAGHIHAYYKRRLAHRLGKYIDGDAHIVDAIKPLQSGFMSPFIEGISPKREEMQSVHTKTQKLEQVFDDIGMPTLSFSSRHFGSRRKNFIVQNDQVHVVDYEQSVPVPDLRGNMGYDVIYFDGVGTFINDNKLQILNKLGTEESHNLNEAFELSKQYQEKLDIRPRGLTRLAKSLSREEMDKTVERLYNESKISEKEIQDYRSGKTGDNIKLAVPNLLMHLATGIITPTGVGAVIASGARLGWTLANFSYYSLTHNYDRRRIHNEKVMLFTLFPVVGNFAYLISIAEENPQIGLAIADNIMKELKGISLEEWIRYVSSKNIFRQGVMAYGKAYEAISHIEYIRKLPDLFLVPNSKMAHDVLLDYAIKGARTHK